ncbi:putative tetratricopeptide-like helical domain superfamily [Helianthus annuus]|uniref:Tetratricopeptide-like helical domain superfamily n=2 Tax=Helianthus annuus TaxID=4232 RepID=A0A9K3NUD9_HELAN|nr:pentatricopeptide repeat-containing protein At2g15980 [Helianthus annuus]XP_022036424.1 pentatricopeptide repeat-containing protein At2g15980 [Helianthus annuus]XP_035844751.1 pentatricopeptide repeat-containing protein At2g15980 [Helianthus annuus]KAF5812360.1 putative tetratricopeptide-like helical domain superfamily [Helianthus annuus]KAJ0591282.1 putative tetratricopeptide-like helical domain superfamily [Helianthus annuus]
MALVYSKHPHFITPTTILHFFSSSSAAADPTVTSADPTVTSAVTVLKHHRSKSRWTHLRTLFPSGFTPSQFSQITLNLHNNPHLAFNFFQFTIQHSLCNHSPSSYASIIHTLARSRHKSQTLTLIQTAIRKFHDPNADFDSNTPRLMFETLVKTYRMFDSAPFVFDLLIKACLLSKRVEHAIEIVRMLRSKGLNPMISTCNSLILSVCKHHGSIAGYETYTELFESSSEFSGKKVAGVKIVVPNVHTYNIMMHAFYKDGLIERLERVWSDMIVNMCVPSEYSYSVLMAAYCDDGRMDDATRVWEEMGNGGLEHDVVAYNTMIGGFCEAGNVRKAEEFFMQMGLSEKKSSSVTYEHLINGYCKLGDVDSGMLLFKDLCRKGFTPIGFTIDLLIKELCVNNMVSEALMVSRFALKNNVVISGGSYEFLIKGLCNEGRMEESMKVQAEMVGKGYEPNSEIYSAFISGYEKEGNVELAGKLRTEFLEMQ